MEVDDARREFPDGRLSLLPDLPFGKDRYHVALVQRHEQTPKLLREGALVVVLFRRQLNHAFQPVDDFNEGPKPL